MTFILKEDHQFSRADLMPMSLQPGGNLLFFSRLVKLAGERERFELSYLEHGIKA
jgi:hypothetical protein